MSGKIRIANGPGFNEQMSAWGHTSDKAKRVLKRFWATWAFRGPARDGSRFLTLIRIRLYGDGGGGGDDNRDNNNNNNDIFKVSALRLKALKQHTAEHSHTLYIQTEAVISLTNS